MEAVETACYLRMRVLDKPGVLADITRTMADSKISIEAMVQKEPRAGEAEVDIIMLTHLTVEKNVDAAIAKLEKLPVVVDKVTRLRLEELN
jgi:homoserine dehydrogenase